MLEITSEIKIPLSTIHFTFSRSSGPGGQNVNKVSSKAQLRWNMSESGLFDPETIARFTKLFPAYCTNSGDVLISNQESRDAPKNRAACLERLREMLLESLYVPKPRKPTRPSAAAVKRRLEDKSRQSKKKELRKKKFDT